MSTKPDTDTGWGKEDPKVDGVYWWRADANDNDPDIHSVVNGRFYEVGMSQCTTVENFGGEWLGPFTPSDFEQLIRLRKAASDALAYLDRESRRDYPFNKEPQNIARALSEALAPTGEQS